MRDDTVREIVEDVVLCDRQDSAILQGQLIVEDVANKTLQIITSRDWQRKIGGTQFTYFQKLSILYGFGVTDKTLYQSLVDLGTLRNKIAHNKKCIISPEEQERFFESVPKTYIRIFIIILVYILSEDAARKQDSEGIDESVVSLPVPGRRVVSAKFILAIGALAFALAHRRDQLTEFESGMKKMRSHMDDLEGFVADYEPWLEGDYFPSGPLPMSSYPEWAQSLLHDIDRG